MVPLETICALAMILSRSKRRFNLWFDGGETSSSGISCRLISTAVMQGCSEDLCSFCFKRRLSSLSVTK